LLEFYVEAVLATYEGGLKKTRVSIAGPGPALLAVLEGLMYYNFPDNSPSRRERRRGSVRKARHTNRNLEINVSRETLISRFFYSYKPKISRKKNSRFMGVTSLKFFARLISRFLFLEIYVLSYTAVNLEIFSL